MCSPRSSRALRRRGIRHRRAAELGRRARGGEYLEQLRGRDDRVTIACACPRVRSLLDTPAVDRLASWRFARAAGRCRALSRADLRRVVLITYVGDCPSATIRRSTRGFRPPGFSRRCSVRAFRSTRSQRRCRSATREWTTTLRRRRADCRRFVFSRELRWIACCATGTLARSTGRTAVRVASNVLLDLAIAARMRVRRRTDRIEESEPPRSAIARACASRPTRSFVRSIGPRVHDTHHSRTHPRSFAVAAPTKTAAAERAPVSAAPVASSDLVPTRSAACDWCRAGCGRRSTQCLRRSGDNRHVPRRRPVASHDSRHVPTGRRDQSSNPCASRRQALLLVVIPLAVLACDAALGVGAYRASASRPTGSAAEHRSFGAADSATRNAARGDVGPSDLLHRAASARRERVQPSAPAVPPTPTPLQAIDSSVARHARRSIPVVRVPTA